jgi:glucan biosynthesis protein C
MLAGFSEHYVNTTSTLLAYLTAAVLPVYVLHQPIMIATAYLIFPLQLPLFLEGLLILVMTTTLPLICYEVLIRRLKPMRFLFGLK